MGSLQLKRVGEEKQEFRVGSVEFEVSVDIHLEDWTVRYVASVERLDDI